jgi:hypothetical protein
MECNEEKGYHLKVQKRRAQNQEKCPLNVRLKKESGKFMRLLRFGLDVPLFSFALQSRFSPTCNC